MANGLNDISNLVSQEHLRHLKLVGGQVVVFIFIAVEEDLGGLQLLHHGLAHLVKVRILQELLGRRSEIRVELEHLVEEFTQGFALDAEPLFYGLCSQPSAAVG